MNPTRPHAFCGFVLSLAVLAGADAVHANDSGRGFTPNFVVGDLIQLSGSPDFPNGAWCWFQDPRAIVDVDAPGGPLLLVSSFSAHERAEYAIRQWTSEPQGDWAKGDNDLYWLGLNSGEAGQVKIHSGLTQDDHNVGALMVLPDGRFLVAYADHGYERDTYFRISSTPHDPSSWGPLTTFTHGDGVTYSNLYSVPGDNDSPAIINFNRSVGYDPNAMMSFDNGATWSYQGQLLGGEGRPYVRYAQGDGRVHFIATDQHPRDYDNSVYHGYTDGRAVYDSGGRVVDSDISDDKPAEPISLTRLHEGAPDAVGWLVDLEVAEGDLPYAVYSVQRDGEGRGNLPGLDHRYNYARFDGEQWHTYEIAHAGTALYEFEQDYTGLAALDPEDPDYVVISTNSDPVSGAPLLSRTDGKRHWELFEGRTSDGGETWTWTPLTQDSVVDNLRPVIPEWDSDRRVLVWMRGHYRSFNTWDTQMVAIVNARGDIRD